MKRKLILSAVCISLLMPSCEKASRDDNSPAMNFLTASAWVIQRADQRDNNGPWLDIFTFQPACVKDDKWIFKSNFSLEYNDAANPCTPNGPNYVMDEVTWSFADNESKLVIENDTYIIERLDANNLIIFSAQNVGGSVAETRITFQH